MNKQRFYINNIYNKSCSDDGIYPAAKPIKQFTKPAFVFIIKFSLLQRIFND